jgi:plastocyanin
VYEVIFYEGCFNYEEGGGNLTIKRGETVKFVNFAENWDMWVASNPHPTHELYPEFNAGRVIRVEESWSFTFTKAGSWGYHDHLHPQCGGTITVQ